MKRWIGLVFMLGVILAGNLIAAEKPLVVILLGPPGAGKGTHAGPLSQHLGLPHISTGDLFREHIRNMTPLGKQAKSFMDKGNLVPDELVLDMLFDRVKRDDCKLGYILDGFPRTLPQAEILDQKIKAQTKIIALNFKLSDKAVIERISGRIACKECGRPYHMKFDPPQKELICDQCEGKLIQRDDDKEDVVRKRLEVYRKQTEPLIAYYTNQKGRLKEINSELNKDEVFQAVLKAVPLEAPSITCF